MRILVVFLAVVSTLFFACEIEKPIDYDVRYKGDKFVLYGLLYSGGVTVSVSHTVHPLHHTDNNMVQNATISLFANGQKLFDLQKVNERLFVSPPDFKPNADTEYHIEAYADGIATAVSASQKLPQLVKIERYWIESGEHFFKFTDPASVENFYTSNAKAFFPDSVSEFSLFPRGFAARSDVDINGKTVVEHKWESLSMNKTVNDTMQDIMADSAQVKLFSYSKDLYLHLYSLDEYEGMFSNTILDIPPIIYTNINNGFGIFGSFSVDSLTIPVPPK